MQFSSNLIERHAQIGDLYTIATTSPHVVALLAILASAAIATYLAKYL